MKPCVSLTKTIFFIAQAGFMAALFSEMHAGDPFLSNPAFMKWVCMNCVHHSGPLDSEGRSW